MSETAQQVAETDIESEAVTDYRPLDELLSRIESRTAKVAVIGQGYVGLPVAMRAAELGFPTVGYEIDPRRCQALAEGTSYVEDVSSERLQSLLGTRYRPSSGSGPSRT